MAVLYAVLRLVVLAPVAFGELKYSLTDTVRCTSHGKEVECFDVSTCERGVAKKVAIASVFDAHVNIKEMCSGKMQQRVCSAVDYRVKLAELGRRAGVDVIFVVPRRDLQLKPINGSVFKRLAAGGVDVRISEWITPPNLSPGVPLDSGGCCGAREFMKLAAYGFADYDALIVVDNDFEVDDVRDLWPIFDCAAQGHVITTRGPHTGANGAFVAFPPSAELQDALLAALSTATARHPAPGPLPPASGPRTPRDGLLRQVSKNTGWNGAGWGPWHEKFDARMQARAPRPRALPALAEPPGVVGLHLLVLLPELRRFALEARPGRPLRLECPVGPRADV